MDTLKIKDNRAYILLKDLSQIPRELREDVDKEQWLPITRSEMKIENVRINITGIGIIIEIQSPGDQLVKTIIKPTLEKEKRKEISKLPEVDPYSEENKLHEYETKLKKQKFYIGEATLRNYPICEAMLVWVSYGYTVSRKTVKRDVKGLYISFSGSGWAKMGGGVGSVKILFSRLLLSPEYKNVGKLRLTAANTINISTLSEYKGNRFYDLRNIHNGDVKSQILNKRAMEK